MTAVKKVEGRETSGGLRRGIVGVGDERKNKVPVGVVRRDVHGEHVTQSSIKALRSAIGLRMISSARAMNNSALGKQFFGDL